MVRFKNRYCLVELVSEYSLNEMKNNNLLNIIENSIKENLGIIEYCKIKKSFKIIYSSFINKLFIIRVSKNYYKIIKRAMFFINKFENEKLRMKILLCSGSINKCQKRICEYLLVNNKNQININLNN